MSAPGGCAGSCSSSSRRRSLRASTASASSSPITQSVGQIVWARYALALPVLILTTRPADWAGLFRTARPRRDAPRRLVIAISATMVMAVRYLPLAEATVILFAGAVPDRGAVEAVSRRTRRACELDRGCRSASLAVLIVARPGFSNVVRATLSYRSPRLVFFAVYPAHHPPARRRRGNGRTRRSPGRSLMGVSGRDADRSGSPGTGRPATAGSS